MRYGPNFKQNISPEALEKLPDALYYEGEAPDLAHLRGKPIPKEKAEELVYVGERDNLVARYPDDKTHPWRGIWITEYDEDGNVVVRGYGKDSPAIKPPEDGMDRADLGALGMTDLALQKKAKELLDEDYEIPPPGRSALRQKTYARVKAAEKE